jgi:hypothetical protein
MPNLTIRIHNTETGEVIDREMTADELADYQAQQEIDKAKEAERAAKETAKAALFERLGIKPEEAALLLG